MGLMQGQKMSGSSIVPLLRLPTSGNFYSMAMGVHIGDFPRATTPDKAYHLD